MRRTNCKIGFNDAPLMLVTIAALPLANDDEKSGSNSGGSHHGAIKPQVNPMAALGLG